MKRKMITALLSLSVAGAMAFAPAAAFAASEILHRLLKHRIQRKQTLQKTKWKI